MAQVIWFLDSYTAEITCVILLVVLVFAGILLQKISVIKRQMDKVAKKVEEYFREILEEEDLSAGGDFLEKWAASTAAAPQEENEKEKKADPEEQNQLISAVLREIFP